MEEARKKLNIRNLLTSLNLAWLFLVIIILARPWSGGLIKEKS